MSSLWPVSGAPEEVAAQLDAWLSAAEPRTISIRSSGSTGEPKQVRLSSHAIRASVRATNERLGGPGQWTLNLAPTTVAGFMALARDLLQRSEAEHSRRRYTSVVPTQLRRALSDPDQLAALRGCDAVLVGGGPLRAGVRLAAERLGVHVVATYGMTETCGGCVYDRLPLAQAQVRVVEGEVQVAGPMLFDGYEVADSTRLGLNGPVALDRTRTVSALKDGWFRTADLGELVDGQLRILGRADDMVISGGVKVPPTAVETQILETFEELADVAVFGVPDEEWGERVVAVAVLDTSGPEPSLAAVRDAVSPRSWAPRELGIVAALPRLSSAPHAKIDRLALKAQYSGWAAEPPRDLP